jgi:hypothetical protein
MPSSYLKENAIHLHYKDQTVNVVYEIIAVYSGNRTKLINTLWAKCRITDG